jgi:hypothetical protein
MGDPFMFRRKCPTPRELGVGVWIALLVVALGLPGTGCFTRSPDISAEQGAESRKDAEMYMLEHAKARWGYRRPRKRDKRPDYRDGFYLHVAGDASCSGGLRKRQVTNVHAWVTEGSPTGPIIDSKLLNTGFEYKSGFFAGTGVSKGGKWITEIEAHDTIAGIGRDQICQCVNVYASAKLEGRIFLRSYDQFCPEGMEPAADAEEKPTALLQPSAEAPPASTPASSRALTRSAS